MTRETELRLKKAKERLAKIRAKEEFLARQDDAPKLPAEGTQKYRVLQALKAAGSKGVLSLTFIEEYMPRAASRVYELKRDGWNIQTEHEGEYARYFLIL